MDNSKVLYYPYINVPKKEWIYKSVLYWDEVGVIIPPKYGEQLDLTDQFTRNLLTNELITEVDPNAYYDKLENSFTEFFLRILSKKKYINLRRKAFKHGVFSRIHVNKFEKKLMDELVKMKLAKREEWSSWYFVEEYTANLLLTYLANIIGKLDNYSLATDELINFKINVYKEAINEKLINIREKVLEDILPFPHDVDLRKLKNFKEQNYDKLIDFRIKIETLILDLADTKNQELYDKKYKLKIDEIHKEKDELVIKMNESRLGEILLSTIGGATTAALILINDPESLLALGPLWTSVYAAVNEYDKSKVGNSKLSYLALVNKNLKKK